MNFLKKKKKLLVKVEDAGGRSPKGKALIMHIQSIFDYSLKKYLYRQLKPTADFEWEFFISKAMGEIGVSPKVIHESHKDKYFMMDFIENSVNLRTGMVPDEECIRQTGIYLRKIHDFSPAKKPPDSNNFMAKVFNLFTKNVERIPILSRFINNINKLKELLKIFEKNCKRCLCHNDFGLGGNILWDKKRIWVVDWEHSGYYYPYFDLGSAISILWFSSNNQREILLDGYFGRQRTEKEEALVYIGETLGLLQYSVYISALIPNVPDNINEKFFDDILEWNALLTGKMKLNKVDSDTNIRLLKMITMFDKQVKINMSTQKFQNYMKLLTN